MFGIGVIMWTIATMHLGIFSSLKVTNVFVDSRLQGMNCFRMIRGYVDHALTPGGAVAYLGNLAPWDHVFKDTLYATQEIFGDAVAVSDAEYHIKL